MGNMDRRAVLIAGTTVTAAGVLAACGGSKPDGAPSGSAESGPIPLSSIAVGGGVVVPEHEVVVTQPSAGTVLAFSAVCPHQGCLVSEVEENSIVCPCHNSVFSAIDGSVQSGPAPNGLAQASVRVENGNVILG